MANPDPKPEVDPGGQGPCSRDVVLLDIALEGYLRLRVDRMEKSSMSGDDLISVVTLVLRSHLCTMPHPDFQQVSLTSNSSY